MFKNNVDFLPVKKISAWRKIAIGTWPRSGDPTIYALIEIDARPLIKKMHELKAEGKKITPTVILAKALAKAIQEYPKMNSVLRLGRLYQRKNINIFLQVAADDHGENLTGLVVQRCNEKSLEEIAEEIKARSIKIRSGDDPDFKEVKNTLEYVPGMLMAPLLKMLGFVLYTLNLWSPVLGAPRDSFGSAMVTSVGMLGIEHAFAPLVPYSRCPVLLAVGEITEKVIVENGEMIICPMLPLSATIDHRVVDGLACSKMLKALKLYLTNPT